MEDLRRVVACQPQVTVADGRHSQGSFLSNHLVANEHPRKESSEALKREQLIAKVLDEHMEVAGSAK